MIYKITLGSPKSVMKSIVLNTVASLANLVPFVCLVKIVDMLFAVRKTGKPDGHLLWLYFGVMGLFFVLTFLLESLATKYTYEKGYQTTAAGRIQLADHLRALPIGSLSGKSSTEIADTLMNDFFKVEAAMTHQLPQFLSGISVAVICSFIFLIVDVRIGLAALIGFPVALLFLQLTRGLQKALHSKIDRARLTEQEEVEEYLNTIKTLKAYDCIQDALDRIAADIGQTKKASIKNESGVGSLATIASMVLRVGLPLMSLVGSYLLLNDGIGIETFFTFLFVATRVFDPLDLALTNYSGLQMASLSGENILKFLNTKPMAGEGDLNAQDDIELEHVSFAYDEMLVLDDVSLSIKQNELTALVGPSGSGKSTLIKLISRFYDPDRGAVKIGGVNLAQADPEKVMEKFSVVFQDVYLFQDTIYNNIKFGKEEASKADVIEAAKLAGAYDFIMEKEKGFETMVGEGGSTLSGGEKQRISIARAILKDAPIILLDEATSSLDPENEAVVQKAISNLIRHKTVIVIAQKLKDTAAADKIVVLDAGKVAQEGKHDALIAQDGIYKKLWMGQEQSKEWQIAN